VPKDEYRPPAKKGKTAKLTKGEMEDQAFKAAMRFGAGLPGADADNNDVIANRAKSRLANIDAAARLKAELEGREYVPAQPAQAEEEVKVQEESKEDLPVVTKSEVAEAKLAAKDDPMGEIDPQTESPRGIKRAREEAEVEAAAGEGEDEGVEVEVAEIQEDEDDNSNGNSNDDDGGDESPPNPDAAADATSVKKKLKFNADGTVDGYVDDVRLWEPGYRERYYRSKFGVEVSDTEFMAK
jgi:5'-3' exoribonuclease 2